MRLAPSCGATAVFGHPFLYGAILSFDKPGDYQIARNDALRKGLGDVTGDFENLLTKDLPALNDALKAKGKEPTPRRRRKSR